MNKYTFVSLGQLESFGIRLGGAGLGNILFPWATSIVYAKDHNLTRIQTTWKSLKLGTFIRKEKDKRMYYNLFTGRDGISGIRKFFLLNFSKKIKYFSDMDKLFDPFKHEHSYVKQELFKIVNPEHIKKANRFDSNSIAIHIRRGDFSIADSENLIREGGWNYQLPLKWYKTIIKKIRKFSNMPIYVFSDAEDEYLKDILNLENCNRVHFGSAISDMIALSNARLLVASGSTFSMWASFLGQNPTIWFPGQMRQSLINKSSYFEGEIDYNDRLPELLINILNND